MSSNTLVEISRQVISIPKTDDPSVFWHDSAFILLTPKFIHVYEYSYDLKCIDKSLDFVESVIQAPTLSPATHLMSNNFISFGMSNFELSQLIVDTSLWAHSPQIVKEMVSVTDCKWSPNEFYFQTEPMLAVLNNIGNVNIFGRKNGTWENLLDLSACVNNKLNLKLPTQVRELKIKADIVESSAVCWAPAPNHDGSCLLVLGQKNGNILLWSLSVNQAETKVKAKYKGRIESDTYEVKSILWIDKCEGNFSLVISNVFGQIILYECRASNDLEMLKMHVIWPHKDKMIAQYLFYTQVNNNLIIFFDKHRHFVAQLLDQDYKVISQYADNVNDYKITTISGNTNEFFLGTVNLQIFKINFVIADDSLDVKLDLIELKESYNNCELYSMSFTKNNQMIAVTMLNRTVSIRKKPPHVDIVFFSTNDCNNSFLLNNDIKNIINIWDAIELLRYKILKSKVLPLDLNKLLIDGDTDTYKLKLYIVIAKIWQSLEDNLKVYQGQLPEEIDKVKEKVMLIHAQSQLNDLHKLILQESISDFEMETFIATKVYLRYYSEKYKEKLGNLISPDVFNSVESERKYICQSCDNEIENFSCSSGHLSMFCSISFTPIETRDYLLCTVCGSTARIELYERKAKCIFCDRYLQKYL